MRTSLVCAFVNMRIFIVGAGITGGLLAQLLVRAGHDVRCGLRKRGIVIRRTIEPAD